METLKKVINILVMVYLVIALLFLLHILSVDKFVALFELDDAAVFYNRLLWMGAVLLLAELLVENAYIATLKRGLEREHRKLTELKAQLYDQRLKAEAAAAPPVVVVPSSTQPLPEEDAPQTPRPNDRPVIPPAGPFVPPAPTMPGSKPEDLDLPSSPNHQRPLP